LWGAQPLARRGGNPEHWFISHVQGIGLEWKKCGEVKALSDASNGGVHLIRRKGERRKGRWGRGREV